MACSFYRKLQSLLFQFLYLLDSLFSRVAFYQASVRGFCDGPSGDLSVRLSVGRSVGQPVCLSAKCIVAKRLSGFGCRWGGEWGRSSYGCIGWSRDRRRRRGSFGVNLERPTVTSGDFATRLFPNYFGQILFTFLFYYLLFIT